MAISAGRWILTGGAVQRRGHMKTRRTGVVQDFQWKKTIFFKLLKTFDQLSLLFDILFLQWPSSLCWLFTRRKSTSKSIWYFSIYNKKRQGIGLWNIMKTLGSLVLFLGIFLIMYITFFAKALWASFTLTRRRTM